MAEELIFDVVEQILIRSDVEDLLRCKSVCKSWQSLISSPRFVKAHLDHSHMNDRNNPQLGHRRIALSFVYTNLSHVIGSCNGLVCFSPYGFEFLVANTSTGEQIELPTPPCNIPDLHKHDTKRDVVCWGFGYDSSEDDYKAVAGFYSKNRTLFNVLTLKSNIWKVIGEVRYRCHRGMDGILCGRALHWLMGDANNKVVIITLDLSTEEFKEIPLPAADVEYEWNEKHRLGVLEGCLCVYTSCFPMSFPLSTKKWVMKNNKWELYNDNHCENKYDVAHKFRAIWDSGKIISYHEDGERVPSNGDYLRMSVFVKSLVSPHPRVNNNNSYDGQQRNVKPGEEGNKSVESGDTRKRKRKRKRKRTRKHKRQL